MSESISRRDALKRLGALAGAAAVGPRLLGGCGDDDAAAEPGRISTIVFLMMENRSFDHYFGARSLLEGRPVDGLVAGMSNPDRDGVLRPIYHETLDCVADPPHGWNPSRLQFNAGANDGFMKAYQNSHGADAAPHPMGYFAREQLPVLWGLADHYAVCDRWFSSVMGPTWPNRLYLHAAQSGGAITNQFPDGGERFKLPTIYDRLQAAGIEWRSYFTDLPSLAIFHDIPVERLKFTNAEFVDQARAGTLPPVVFIDPGFVTNDDHPPHHPMMGQVFIATIYAILAASPQWKEMLLVITYDEHGGFFDHVPPPKAPDERADLGFDQLGFRVPTVVAGPYVKQGFVSSVQRDHTSIMKHIQGMFGLDPLTMRDAAASDLSDIIDTERLARGEPAPPAQMPAVEIDESSLDRACQYAPIPISQPTELELAMDSGLLPRELDRRGSARDTLYFLGDVLDSLGAGRIRRGR